MADNKIPTIAEEAGLPENWVPIDVAPIIPSRPPQLNPDSSSSSSAPPVGSLPPSYQQNADFVRNAYRGQSTPNLSLMPLGIQGNPSSNAGIQSTAKTIVTAAIAAIPPAPAAATTDIDDGLVHGDAIWESDSAYTLIRDDFNGSALTTSGNVGEIGWTVAGANGGATNAGRWNPFTPDGFGGFNISNSSTAAGFVNINLVGTNTRDTLYPLFDYPNWKATFVFALVPGDVFASGSYFTQKALYIGLGANPASSGTNAWAARPHIFMGLRYDTDTTAPAISDATFKFEVVTNFNGTAVTRVNTQGTVVNTGVTPAFGSYRLEIQCVASGVITMSLNGSAPVSFNIPTLTTGTAVFGGEAVKVQDGVALLNPDTAGGTLYNANVFSAGSKVTLASFTAPFASFNGAQTLVGVGDGSTSTHAAILTSIGNQGNQTNSGTITGFPAVVPFFSFGNDTQAAPVNGATSLLCDFFSLIWNPGVGGGTGTPVSTKSRYF